MVGAAVVVGASLVVDVVTSAGSSVVVGAVVVAASVVEGVSVEVGATVVVAVRATWVTRGSSECPAVPEISTPIIAAKNRLAATCEIHRIMLTVLHLF